MEADREHTDWEDQTEERPLLYSTIPTVSVPTVPVPTVPSPHCLAPSRLCGGVLMFTLLLGVAVCVFYKSEEVQPSLQSAAFSSDSGNAHKQTMHVAAQKFMPVTAAQGNIYNPFSPTADHGVTTTPLTNPCAPIVATDNPTTVLPTTTASPTSTSTEATTTEATTTEATTTEAVATEVTTTETPTETPTDAGPCAGVTFTSAGTGQCTTADGPTDRPTDAIQNADVKTVADACKQKCCGESGCRGYAVRGEEADHSGTTGGSDQITHPNCIRYIATSTQFPATVSGGGAASGIWSNSECFVRA